MTRATKQAPTPDQVDLGAESSGPATRSKALNLAQASALGVAKGTGSVVRSGAALGAYLLGQGYTLAKSGLERQKRVPVAALVDEDLVVAAGADAAPRGRRLRRVVIVGALGVAVAAGVAVWRMRRPEPAPVADQPPSLRDLDAPEQES